MNPEHPDHWPDPIPDREPGIRKVRSFVLRAGRLTEGQAKAMDTLWPIYGLPYQDEPIDLESKFGRSADTILEIGFGNGESTWRMAQAEPDTNFIGCEVHLPGVGHLLQALDEHGLDNVRIIASDVVAVLENMLPEQALAGVRIYFPDPWPKKKHHKRRLIQPDFLTLLASRMVAGAQLHLATDWPEYAEHMLETMQAHQQFESETPGKDYVSRPDWRPETKFERRGIRKDHPVRDLLWRHAPDL